MFSKHCPKYLIWMTIFGIARIHALKNALYIIHNAETNGRNQLSSYGVARASQCLPDLFGADSARKVGLILTCRNCPSAVQTANLAARSLALSVNSCAMDPTSDVGSCLLDLIAQFEARSEEGILLIWDETNLVRLLHDVFLMWHISLYDSNSVIYLRNGLFVTIFSQGCSPDVMSEAFFDTKVTRSLVSFGTTVGHEASRITLSLTSDHENVRPTPGL